MLPTYVQSLYSLPVHEEAFVAWSSTAYVREDESVSQTLPHARQSNGITAYVAQSEAEPVPEWRIPPEQTFHPLWRDVPHSPHAPEVYEILRSLKEA